MTTSLSGVAPDRASLRAERLFLPAVFVTNLGNNIQLIAASLLVYKTSGTTLSVGWIYVLVAAPQVALSVLFGRWADRFDRRKLCVTADVLSALTALFLPVWLLFGKDGSNAAYVVSLILAVLSALFMPASLALMKERAHPDRLGSFNANYEIAFQGGSMLSGVLGGFAIQFFGTKPLFFFNAATFIASAVLLFMLGSKPRTAPATADTADTADTDPVEPAGTDQAADRAAAVVPAPATRGPIVRLGLLFSIGSVIVTVANTLLLVAVVDRFKQGAGTLGIADALAGIGMLGAVFCFKRLKDRVDYRLLILLGYGGCAALAFVQPIAMWTLLPGIFLGGFTFAFGRLPARTELMRTVSGERSGRVFGAANGFGLAMSVVLTILVAHVCDTYGILQGYSTLGAFGVLTTVAVIVSLYLRPNSIRGARTSPGAPAVPPVPATVPPSDVTA
ncbi:MFS transporter [Streptomyces sp. NPDC051664]|uniref:MFS transporter n=1 Tax=Streptomyces sp. NPDC051664 TaxID=3365668 RepID=UPI0037B5BFAB